MYRVTFGNTAPAKIKPTHILQFSSDNSIKFMSKKNKLYFHYVGGNVAVSKPQDIFLMIAHFYYMLLCCSNIQVIELMKMTSSQIVPAATAYCYSNGQLLCIISSRALNQ